jgi:hypothetical protein
VSTGAGGGGGGGGGGADFDPPPPNIHINYLLFYYRLIFIQKLNHINRASIELRLCVFDA